MLDGHGKYEIKIIMRFMFFFSRYENNPKATAKTGPKK